ncbi:MAG: GDP-mannose 4,6-dehydratase [Spirulinaceae cyanobacterium]
MGNAIIGDIRDSLLLKEIFAAHNIAAVIHFAGYAYVGESVKHPARYCNNNMAGTRSVARGGIQSKNRHTTPM